MHVPDLRNPRIKSRALLLCFFLGCFGAHKFYERKYALGVLYILTLGLWGLGVIGDFIVLCGKPSWYYVYRKIPWY